MEKQVGKEWAWRKDIHLLTEEQITMFEQIEKDYKTGASFRLPIIKHKKTPTLPFVLFFVSFVLAIYSIVATLI
jgi:hypothetical protein